MELRLPVGKFALFDGIAHFRHDDLVEMQVVDGVQLRAQDFAGAVQMVQVGAAEILAGVAGAAFVYRTLVGLVFGVLIFKSPKRVNSQPLRALRVGITQSNISMPCATPYTRSSGVPTPIR
ncbi:Uncharacterised protein [Neisseria gonorrhoeae]|uniref:Uncharacterized protein n=1 Tax=Neisseria gonorrhoeae TaxID=485 RepID=A0A378W080_NEIGO|nr:Uncharacterised protein [Neisseria gonorrhoeae]